MIEEIPLVSNPRYELERVHWAWLMYVEDCLTKLWKVPCDPVNMAFRHTCDARASCDIRQCRNSMRESGLSTCQHDSVQIACHLFLIGKHVSPQMPSGGGGYIHRCDG